MYDWSTNPIKLRRAIDGISKEATEAEIKAEYVRIGGLVRETEEPVVITEPKPVKKVVKKAAKKLTKKKTK
jgi:hypothetical protein